jgi:transcriptional regulator with XRE-family HTH domain
MFLDLLKQHIEDRGQRFSQIAKHLNKSVSYVNEIHKGRREIRLDDIVSFAEALELDFYEKVEFVEQYLTEKYPELFKVLKMNVSAVESIPVMEKEDIINNKEAESYTHIPVIHSNIKGVLAIKLENDLIKDKFLKGDFLILKLREDSGFAGECPGKYIVYPDENGLYIDKVTINDGKYYFLAKDSEIPDINKIIGYVIGKYTNVF